MNSIYTFYFSKSNKIKEHYVRVCASSYINAIEKSSIILEKFNDEVDLLGLKNWEDVQEECAKYGLRVTDLIEENEE